MLAYPRAFSRELRPLFRLLEEPFLFDRSLSPSSSSSIYQHTTFHPNFDVKETKEAYVLDGELPGITQKSDLDLQFVDPHTLVIKGRIERENESGNPNSEAEAAATAAPTAEAEAEQPVPKPRSPTVEDEVDESETSSTANADTTVAKKSEETTVSKEKTDGHKYWVRERYVGEFQRSFSFPQNVDHEAVKASLKNGILSVVVPKKATNPVRRINVE